MDEELLESQEDQTSEDSESETTKEQSAEEEKTTESDKDDSSQGKTPDFESRLKEETTRIQSDLNERLRVLEEENEALKSIVKNQDEDEEDRIVPKEWDEVDQAGKRGGPDAWEDFARKVRDATIREMEKKQEAKTAEVRKQNETFARQLQTLRDKGEVISQDDIRSVFTFMNDNTITNLEKGYERWKETEELKSLKGNREKKRQEEAGKIGSSKKKFTKSSADKLYTPNKSLDDIMLEVMEEIE